MASRSTSPPGSNDGGGRPAFKTTSWSLVSRTNQPGETAREATAALCRMYWQPLYVYVRRAGRSPHEAEDVVQSFLLHVVENDVFTRADADRGRFRTFLLSSLKQYMARRHRDAQRQKRTPGTPIMSVDVEGAEQMLASQRETTPARAFERAWAMAQLELAWRIVEQDYTTDGKQAVFAALRPVISGQSDRPTRQIAQELRMSEGAANVAAHRLRRRFGEALREQIALTLDAPDDVDDEIAHLQAALRAPAE